MKSGPSTIEYEFRLKYGCYPYTYYQRQLENGLSSSDAFSKLQYNIDQIWANMKLIHKRSLAT